ncbi:hypothetical protein XELAEV_18038237mg [Xenopus laevis]|uniref:Uncharacterized protein n=1 Tax=Xenopus laevis TaxID=8355 RepID=A0A974C5C5_XENLA|nr:hypothetical protein XELAEV_18038237mg [Xenopus laevis]
MAPLSNTFIMPISVSAPGGTLTPSSSGKGICAWSWTRSRMPAAWVISRTYSICWMNSSSLVLVTQLADIVRVMERLYPPYLLTATDLFVSTLYAYDLISTLKHMVYTQGHNQGGTGGRVVGGPKEQELGRTTVDDNNKYSVGGKMVTAGNLSLALEISMIFSWEGAISEVLLFDPVPTDIGRFEIIDADPLPPPGPLTAKK